MNKRDQVDKIITDTLFRFTHMWVDGFGWENTIKLPSDFDKVLKIPTKEKDGGQLFLAYTCDEENKETILTKFKGFSYSSL